MNRLLRHLVDWWIWLLALGLIILSVQLSGPDGPTRFQLYAGVPYRIAADSQLLLARDGQIMHLPDGQVIRRITAFGQSEFSTNGAFLAVRSQKARVDIVRTADQSMPISVTLKSLDLESLTINTTGTWLAISTGYGGPDALLIYDISTDHVVAMLPPDRQSIRQLLFTPDDRYLFVHGDTSTRIFDTTTWQMVYQNTSITGPFAFSAPNYLLAINTDRSFALIEIHDRVAQPPRRIPLPYTIIDAFTFSPDGQYLAVIDHSGSGGIALVGTGDGSSHVVRMALVRVSDGMVVQRFEGPAGAMSNPTFTPDGQQIITIGPVAGLTFWQVAPRGPWDAWLRLLPFLGVVLLLLDRLVLWIIDQRRGA
jgi:hypothetical protein